MGDVKADLLVELGSLLEGQSQPELVMNCEADITRLIIPWVEQGRDS
jgi:hypothetical protein